MSETVKKIVEEECQNERLDKVLGEYFPDTTRSKLQSMIKNGLVLVNGDVCKSNYKVKINDEIELTFEEEALSELVGEDIPLDIVYEDEDIIVVNKKRGMVVHPAVGNPSGTLVNALVFHSDSLSDINGEFRPGIVHRIDKDTTGLLVVAKNNTAHAILSAELQAKTMKRKYYALVSGVIPHSYGTIDAPIGRDPKFRQQMCVTEDNSKEAKTHFNVEETFVNHTFVSCELETGRTHQIRVHMKYIKHPVVGDPVYGRKEKGKVKVPAQLLHAYELTLTHPTTKEVMVFHAPLPEDFEAVLDAVRRGEML